MDSSVAFESLYFKNKYVLAYKFPNQTVDEEYLKLLNTFTSEDELIRLLMLLDEGKLPPKDGTEFFKSKYGIVDGKEVERIAKIRKWDTPMLGKLCSSN